MSSFPPFVADVKKVFFARYLIYAQCSLETLTDCDKHIKQFIILSLIMTSSSSHAVTLNISIGRLLVECVKVTGILFSLQNLHVMQTNTKMEMKHFSIFSFKKH